MVFQTLASAIMVCLTMAAASRAAETPPVVADPNSIGVQQPYAQLGISTESVTSQPILQSQYIQPPAADLTYVPPYPPAPSESCEICGNCDPCPCDTAWCRSGWKLGFELYGLQSHLTDNTFGRWPDDGGGAARISLGYEWMSGFGIRASTWGFAEDARLPGPDVELTMGTFQLDFYKAITSGHSELVLGAGPTGGGLTFRVPSLNGHTEFRGGGASVFAEGYHPFVRRPQWELAFVGETRLSLLAGEWRDNGIGIVDDTDGDSMSIWEIGFGLEYRHRCGRCYDHYWFVQAMPEYQQWSSEWMADELDTSIALTGMNLNFGFAW